MTVTDPLGRPFPEYMRKLQDAVARQGYTQGFFKPADTVEVMTVQSADPVRVAVQAEVVPARLSTDPPVPPTCAHVGHRWLSRSDAGGAREWQTCARCGADR